MKLEIPAAADERMEALWQERNDVLARNGGYPEPVRRVLNRYYQTWPALSVEHDVRFVPSQGAVTADCALHSAIVAASVFRRELGGMLDKERLRTEIEAIQGVSTRKLGSHPMALGPAINRASDGRIQWWPIRTKPEFPGTGQEWDNPLARWVASVGPALCGHFTSRSWSREVDNTVELGREWAFGTAGHATCAYASDPKAGIVRHPLMFWRKTIIGATRLYNPAKKVIGGWQELEAWVTWRTLQRGLWVAIGLTLTD